jgi:hypothetical protein
LHPHLRKILHPLPPPNNRGCVSLSPSVFFTQRFFYSFFAFFVKKHKQKVESRCKKPQPAKPCVSSALRSEDSGMRATNRAKRSRGAPARATAVTAASHPIGGPFFLARVFV